jgi:hypothetical protein
VQNAGRLFVSIVVASNTLVLPLPVSKFMLPLPHDGDPPVKVQLPGVGAGLIGNTDGGRIGSLT